MEPARSLVTKGLMEGLILHAINQEPSHGYGIITQLDHVLGERPNKNQVYPLLHELEEQDLIRSESVDDGRQKQVYHLTPAGQDRLQEYRRLPPPFKRWLAGLFSLPTEPDLAPPRREHDTPEHPETDEESPSEAPRNNKPRVQTSARTPGASWVPHALEELPQDADVRAPFAKLHFDRDPHEGSWTLEIRQHDPGNYKDADSCPLTFIYFAIQRLLFQDPYER